MTGRTTPLFLLLSCLIALSVQGLSGAAADAPRIVQQFIDDIEKNPVPYRALRRLEASSEKLNESGWMEALTEYSHESGFQYRMVGQGGSERIRNRALKPVLDAEKESLSQWRTAALTRENYDFSFDSFTDDGLIKIQLNPRRRDSRLVEGVALVSARSGELVRLEGRLSKSPSFWVRWVSVTRRYVPILGTMMPAAVESTADVRIAGVSKFTMTYEYSMVDGALTGVAPRILALK